MRHLTAIFYLSRLCSLVYKKPSCEVLLALYPQELSTAYSDRRTDGRWWCRQWRAPIQFTVRGWSRTSTNSMVCGSIRTRWLDVCVGGGVPKFHMRLSNVWGDSVGNYLGFFFWEKINLLCIADKQLCQFVKKISKMKGLMNAVTSMPSIYTIVLRAINSAKPQSVTGCRCQFRPSAPSIKKVGMLSDSHCHTYEACLKELWLPYVIEIWIM